MITNPASKSFPCEACEVRDRAICSVLSFAELKELNDITTMVSVDDGRNVFEEGGDADYLFNIVAGVIRLSKLLPDGRRQITGFLFPGDFLGLAITDKYVYDAEAMGATQLCRFSRGGLNQIMERFPQLEHRLLQLASNELVQAQSHLMILGRKTAQERIATLLLDVRHRLNQKTEQTTEFDLPISREDMADYCGLTIETVSRTLTKLRKAKIIDFDGPRHMRIENIDELQACCGDM